MLPCAVILPPSGQGERLDACLSNADACGRPAAGAFCKAEGFDIAILFQREPVALTRKLNSPGHCEGPSCMSFKQIKCFSPKDDFAGLRHVAD